MVTQLLCRFLRLSKWRRARANAFTDAVGENLSPPTGDGGESGILEAAKDFGNGKIEEAGELDEFRRREGVDVDGGEFFADAAEEIFVVFDGKVGVHAALH